jgi:hypothetical protein
VFENRVLRRIFEPKKDEILGEWRKLCNEEVIISTCDNLTAICEPIVEKMWKL